MLLEQNTLSGKIFKKANILAIIVSLLFIICRFFIYDRTNDSLFIGMLGTEISTLLFAVIILIIGEIKYKDSNDKYDYYYKSGKILLISVLAGYAFSLIFRDETDIFDFDSSYILFIFNIVGSIYFYFNFKKNQININHKFINNDNKTYYKNVLMLIGYFAVIVACIYFTCGVLSSIINHSWKEIFTFFLNALSIILALGLQYLILSFVEKIAYNDKINPEKVFILLGGLVIVLLFVELMTRVIAVIDLDTHQIYNNPIARSIVSNKLTYNLNYITQGYIAISLCYLYFFNDSKIKKGISIYLLLMFISTIVGVVDNIHPATFRFRQEYILMKSINAISYITYILYILSFLFTIYALIKEKGLNKFMLIVPIAKIIVYLILIFFVKSNVKPYYWVKMISVFIEFISWSLFYPLVYQLHTKKQMNQELLVRM